MEATVNISAELVGIIQGLMIMLVLAATTILYFRRARTRRGPGRRASAPASEIRGAEARAVP